MSNEDDHHDDDDMVLAAAVAVMAAGVACIDAIRSQLHPVTHSGASETLSSSSSGSNGGTASRKRGHKLVDRIDKLSSEIGRTIEAVKNRHEDLVSALYAEVMKCGGYDEVLLARAFDYLLAHENRARAFLAKNDNLRQAWLFDFFSSGSHND